MLSEQEISNKMLTLLTKDPVNPWFFDEGEKPSAIQGMISTCPRTINSPNLKVDDYREWLNNLKKASWEVEASGKDGGFEISLVQIITAHRTTLMLAKNKEKP